MKIKDVSFVLMCKIYKKLRLEEEVILSCSVQVPRQRGGGQLGVRQALRSEEHCLWANIGETSHELEHGVCHFWGYRGAAADCYCNI